MHGWSIALCLTLTPFVVGSGADTHLPVMPGDPERPASPVGEGTAGAASVPGITADREAADGDAADVFARLEGRWVGTGALLGRPAEFSMRWTTDEAGFVRLAFRNGWVGEDGGVTPVLAAEALYRPGDSTAVGVWLDDRPQRLRLTATLTDSTVITHWVADAEEGRTEYRVRSADEVVVRDFVQAGDVERLFAEASYRREDGAAR